VLLSLAGYSNVSGCLRNENARTHGSYSTISGWKIQTTKARQKNHNWWQ
jgi:hypothetical protein